MSVSMRISHRLWRYIKSEAKSLITFKNNRCLSSSPKDKRCIKQGDHFLWHEDAWHNWWW